MKRAMIKTVNVTDRRDLHFSTMKNLLDDVEQLDEAPSRRATGNWTAAQIVQHVAKLIEFSIDGFPIITRQALFAARANRVVLSPPTLENLAVLGIASDEPAANA